MEDINDITTKLKDLKLKKQNLGQFYTTNYKYILQNLEIAKGVKTIVEPFCGNNDLLKGIDTKKFKIERFDIDPKDKKTIQKDTLLNPPCYKDKFVITNPPYLARNKSKDKKLYDLYDVNDLYKCFIKELLTNQCIGGILIIPLNFWCSIRNSDIELRKSFIETYDIIHLNIFEEQVFDDTSYTICSFLFEKKKDNENKLKITLFPSKHKIETKLNTQNNYIIGGTIYSLGKSNKYSINRITSKNKESANTNLLLKCIDDSEKSKIGLSFVSSEDIYIDNTPNLSSRTYASLIIDPPIDTNTQKYLVEKFNEVLNNHRDKYSSLFLTNYRESKEIARKRISFDLAYSII
jgi:hypothetical protein